MAVYPRTNSVGTSLYRYSVHDLATTRQARNLNTQRHRRVPKLDSRISRISGRPFSAALRPQFELCVDLLNPLNPELNPICYLLTLLAHHFLHVSRIMVKSLTIRLLMSYIYGAHILDVSRSHTTTQHSR